MDCSKSDITRTRAWVILRNDTAVTDVTAHNTTQEDSNMATRVFQILAIIAAIAIVGSIGLTVMATSGSPGGQGSDFMGHLRAWGHHLHGGGHHQDPMARLIDQLELTPDQLQRVDRVHEIIGTYGSEGSGSMAELHDQLVTQFEQGHVETDEIRQVIDEHVDQIRHMAYAATDELIALVNGLDANQREIVLAHLQGDHQEHHGSGH